MLRPLVAISGTSCIVFALCVMANVIAIRAPISLTSDATHIPRVEPRLEPSPGVEPASLDAGGPKSDPIDELDARLRTLADAVALDALASSETPFRELARGAATLLVDSELLLRSDDRGVWVTRTEIRAPCRALDTLLTELRDPRLGGPRHCERWVEATAERLEHYGITQPSAREFLDSYGGPQSVRVLWVYSGWRPAEGDPQVELVAAEPASLYPRSEFGRERRDALDRIYAELELGPHRRELEGRELQGRDLEGRELQGLEPEGSEEDVGRDEGTPEDAPDEVASLSSSAAEG